MARQSLAEAEVVVRARMGRTLPFGAADPWKQNVQQALDLAKIAMWVAERDQRLLREDAEALLRAARSSIERQRHSRHYSALPGKLRGNLTRAELSMSEADYLLRGGELEAALEKARTAFELAGGVDSGAEELLARYRDPAQLEMWASWVEKALLESRKTGSPVLVVDKHHRLAILYAGGRATAWFDVDLGRNSLRQKQRANDEATPEGLYRVVEKKSGSLTRYYKALLLDYPNARDRARFAEALRSGQIPEGSRIGGLIEIHGDGGRANDWTDGCVAVSNSDMDLLYGKLTLGSVVAILGSYEPSPALKSEQ